MSKIKKIQKLIRQYRTRNDYTATGPAVPNQVNLYWCTMELPDGSENLGDCLSRYIVRETFQRLADGRNYDQDVGETRHLYAVGSILFYGMQKATVWGSGMHEDAPWYRMPAVYKLDIRAVRGPLTGASLRKNGFQCPEVYGDPAVLLPLYYAPRKLPMRECVVVKHKDSIIDHGAYHEVDILTKDMFATIDEIVNAKLVLSGSLHGIIIAETYGVPAIYVRQMEDRWGGDYKYKDWYYSTGRQQYPVADTIEEALNMPIPEVPDLTQMRERLLGAFPIDLWDRKAVKKRSDE